MGCSGRNVPSWYPSMSPRACPLATYPANQASGGTSEKRGGGRSGEPRSARIRSEEAVRRRIFRASARLMDWRGRSVPSGYPSMMPWRTAVWTRRRWARRVADSLGRSWRGKSSNVKGVEPSSGSRQLLRRAILRSSMREISRSGRKRGEAPGCSRYPAMRGVRVPKACVRRKLVMNGSPQ